MSLLKAKIKKLPKKHLNLLTDDELSKTQAFLKGLYQEFGVDVVLSSLYKYWSLEETINYFLKAKKNILKKENIKTIAVYCVRISNGGIGRVVASLIDLWVKMGYKVVLLTSVSDPKYDFKYNENVKRYIVPSVNEMQKRLVELKKICIEEQVDLYINNSWLCEYAVWEIALLNEINVSYITYTHGAYNYGFIYPPNKYLQPNICRLSDAVIAISKDAGYTFYKEIGCNAFLVNNPLPNDLLNKPRCNLDSNRILLIGRISLEKHPISALKIFKKVHQALPNTYLDIVGSQDAFLEFIMKLYIKLHRLSRFIKLHGKVNNETAQKFYANSSCMLFTSTCEGYPMILLEAKSFGLPIVMYDLDYLTLVKGYKGIAVAPLKDTNGLSNALISILKDSNLRKKMSDDSYNNFLDFVNYDLADAWKQIIDGIKTDFVYDDRDTPSKELLNKLVRTCKRNIFGRFARFIVNVFDKN